AKFDRTGGGRGKAGWGLGLSEPSHDATVLWVTELGAIDSVPRAPPIARGDMRAVRGMVEDLLHYIGRNRSVMYDGSNPAARRKVMLGFKKRFTAMQSKFRSLGLPYCAESVHGIG